MHDLLVFFDFRHLPEELQKVVQPFANLADEIAGARVKSGAGENQQTLALQKLLEAKDCAVRMHVAIRDGL